MASTIRVRATSSGETTDIQVLIQHPMDSGFVKDAKGELIPPHFIQELSFEYDGKPTDQVLDACQVAATEVIADFADPWTIDDQHCEVPYPLKLNPLEHLVYLRAEESVKLKSLQ